jgi:hypothetical protein
MAAYFIDCDGTFFEYGSLKPASGAVENVKRLISQGHQVYFITARKYDNNDPSVSLDKTEDVLKSLGIDFAMIIGGVTSPRTIIDDDVVRVIKHNRNSPLIIRTAEGKIKSAYDALCTLRYICGEAWFDADEYVQTLLLAYSLIDAGRFDHRKIVEYYRSCPVKLKPGTSIHECGNAKAYTGQVWKLVNSNDPLYMATDGVTSGAGMKVSPLAMFYKNKEEMLCNTINFTRITHNTPDAILCACLVALRYWQAIQLGSDDLSWLVKEIETVPWLYGIHDFDFFLSVVQRAAKVVDRPGLDEDGSILKALHENIGFGNLCWCAPLSACFWSYKINSVDRWIDTQVHEGPREVRDGDVVIPGDSIKAEVKESYLKRAAGFGHSNIYNWANMVDRDTFFSTALGIVAAVHGVNEKVYNGKTMFEDDLKDICAKLING